VNIFKLPVDGKGVDSDVARSSNDWHILEDIIRNITLLGISSTTTLKQFSFGLGL